ncbi:MAG: hypothetical protein ABI579_02560 [Candidatus Sumerlaeota bacterium]
MENSTHLLLAVGGVFLVSWFGASRLRIDGRIPALRGPLSSIDRALLAALHGEFHQSPGDDMFAGGAVVCTHCGIEYPAGYAYCDCGTETVDVDDVDDASNPVSHLFNNDETIANSDDLICIHVAEDFRHAALLKSYLESHGVESATLIQARQGIYHLSLLPKPQTGLYVHAETAALARQLLQNCTTD